MIVKFKASKQTLFITVFLLIVILLAAGYLLLKVFKKPEVEWRPENSLAPVPAPEITDHGEVEPLIKAIDNSLKYFEKVLSGDDPDPVRFGPHQVPVTRIVESLRDVKARLAQYGLTEQFFRYIRENYRFYRSTADEVLFTGYYEADLKGSLTQSEVYKHPLYRKPDDLYRIDLTQFSFYEANRYKGLPTVLRGRISKDRNIVPYYARDEIDYQDMLKEKGLEIAWVDNPVDVFFLHIQGSGIVQLDTGETLRVNYADTNGHAYRAIGKWLLDRNLLTRDNISMQSIRQYLESHPESMKEIFCYNPSYVFFRVVEDGPIGFLGVPVTPYRSIATDRRLFPRGALCYIDTHLPVFDSQNKIEKWQRFRGFLLNQDTGGAIRTPARVDLFTGFGEKSKLTAGHMKKEGTFYFLLKKN